MAIETGQSEVRFNLLIAVISGSFGIWRESSARSENCLRDAHIRGSGS
jgi:hypothetical protein